MGARILISHRWQVLAAAVGVAMTVSGCSSVTPSAPLQPSPEVPSNWSAPLPHDGRVQELSQWWQGLGDPVLVRFMQAAQAQSPTVSGAATAIEQSRAALTSAQAANLPSLNASLMGQRGVNASSPTVATLYQADLNASWEVDVFGANRRAASAADARLQGAQANWHEARVSVAADVANLVFGWRTCRQVLALVQSDAQSRRETARLTELTAKAGFTAPATAALARASASEGSARITQQQSQCDSLVKALVALTALPEADVISQLNSNASARLPSAIAPVKAVPAQVLAQRPDIYAADRDVAAASADLGSAQAARYPRLMLNGQVGTLNFTNIAGTTDLSTWSIGPVVLSLPLLDGGRRAANVQAAEARYTQAASVYRARVRQAVREVEDALLSLSSANARRGDADQAAVGYAASFEATRARYEAGSASLPELEDARRIALAAQTALAQLELERAQAWVGLYRALGGGWSPDAATP